MQRHVVEQCILVAGFLVCLGSANFRDKKGVVCV